MPEEPAKTPSAAAAALTLCARNVNLTLDGGRQILRNVNLTAKSGSMLAVMGPSGSGKTSLMNLICGRKPASAAMEGDIRLNNLKITPRMRKSFGYVTQEDIFFPQLTLKQTLSFFAQVKLPSSMSTKEKKKRVDEIVELLQLGKCLNTKIGGMSAQGLSGGEKKRANIACELLRNPKVLLLDEPTSGLDSSLALMLMEILGRWVVQQGSIIVSSIHQPSSQTFHEFHELLLLADGQIAYSGRREAMIDYFEGIGVPFHKHWNAADFMLEIIKESSEQKPHVLECGKRFSATSANDENSLPCVETRESLQLNEVHVNMSYQHPDEAEQSNENSTSRGYAPTDNAESETSAAEVGWWTQFSALCVRGFLVSRDSILSAHVLIETAFVAFIISAVWFQLSKSEERISEFVAAVFFISSYASFAPFFAAIMTFYADLAIVKHERKSGVYQIGAYYLSKMVVEIPLLLVVPTLIITPSWWSIGLGNAGTFFAFLAVVTINSLASQGIGIFFSLLTENPRSNMTLAFIYMIFCFLTGGFFNKSMPLWFNWSQYLSYIRYCYHFGLVIVLENTPDFSCGEASQYSVCRVNSSSSSNTTAAAIPGSFILEQQPDDILPIWVNILVSIGMFFAFRLLGYMILRFLRKV